MAKVELYTKDYCPYCDRAKELLKQKGAEYTEYDLMKKPELMAEMQKRNPGARTVPQIFIDDKAIGGFDDLSALNDNGTLDKLLSSGGGSSSPKQNGPKA